MIRRLIFIALVFGVYFFGCTPDPESDTDLFVANYEEQHRPQLHFSPPTHWMNDPNGMVFFEDEYHLFYQYYPDSLVWGPMHWGHAVSSDLVHWEQLPIALAPDSLGYIFSGSAVVDWNNTSGFGEDGIPPLVAIFTYHNEEMKEEGREDFQYQAIAYSNDRGRSWAKYEGNPVLPNSQGIVDFRDPKVIWDWDSDQWVMVLAVKNRVHFYGSPDLKRWRYLSSFGQRAGAHGGVWECPDLFPMMVDGTGDKRWVLTVSINPGGPNGGSATQYFIGKFENNRFSFDAEFAYNLTQQDTEERVVWLDYGRDNYAGVTWSDVDDRRILLGWMSNWDYAQEVPTFPWRSAMTLPRTLALRTTTSGPRLISAFAEELQQLRGDALEHNLPTAISETMDFDVSPQGVEVIVEAAVVQDSSSRFALQLSNDLGENYIIGFDAASNSYFSDRTQAGTNDFSDQFAKEIHRAPRQLPGTLVDMHLIFDVSSVELIADDGLTCMSELFFPSQPFTRLSLLVEGNPVDLQNVEIYPLQSIWR